MSVQPKDMIGKPNEDLSDSLGAIYKATQDNLLEAYKQLAWMHGGAVIALLTFVGHAGTKNVSVGIFACVGLFATGLILNALSMRKSREGSVAHFNREYCRQVGMNYAAWQNATEAEKWRKRAIDADALSDGFTRTALRWYGASVGCFALGALSTLAVLMFIR